MKKRQNHALYILFVVLPMIFLMVIYWFHLEKKGELKYKLKSEWVGSIHHQYIDQVIKETRENLQMLALSGSSFITDKEKMMALLIKASKTDPRYGAMYLLNLNGTVMAGSEPGEDGKKVLTENYRRTALLTKSTVVEDEREHIDGYDYFSVSAPILDEEREVEGFVLARIRLDYMENVMKILTPDYSVKLQNKSGGSLIRINPQSTLSAGSWTAGTLDEVPWRLSVKPDKNFPVVDYRAFFYFAIFGLIITHILFLTVKYLLLRREAKKQKSMMEAQKLEVVGMLAASTAHEIKNPLTGIKGLVQLLEEKYKDKQDELYFSVIKNEIERINSIVSEFLILGKPTAQHLSSIDLCLILEELEPLIQSESRLYNVDFSLHMPEKPVVVLCTRDHLKQVILNIAKNGCEAMAEGGTLAITVYQREKEAVIEIADTGIGMTEKQLRKVFDPFYTNKDTGTGLGLYVCKRIVELFNGSILLSSQEDKGTKAEIILPFSDIN
ncbi:PAS domain-containing sensor histidine kinase [Bacillus sp. MUM 13]|uniref:PAS domain-containing sensor histidine kinase n=1 Tax=Bacillus sp. MUM 13 TaxID=1678001 RepID=UPI0008F5E054|nr:PAS domain-containing sensor histidine kinase [Bacillus sp. MUM 13]OIK14481.1 hypothetical protein BIV59_02815 [Bacillus sp. MUM 13]